MTRFVSVDSDVLLSTADLGLECSENQVHASLSDRDIPTGTQLNVDPNGLAELVNTVVERNLNVQWLEDRYHYQTPLFRDGERLTTFTDSAVDTWSCGAGEPAPYYANF